MYKKILVPLDGSKQAESALRLASKLARISNAEITLLRVVEYPLKSIPHANPIPSYFPASQMKSYWLRKMLSVRQQKNT
jgi:nucleotide-binding universal stress UspA family protein